MEKWVKLETTDGYSVSSDGRIKDSRDRVCKTFDDGGGSLLVKLKKNSLFCLEYVDRLVAKAFVNNPEHYLLLEHIDGDTHNCRAKNLRWCMQWTDKIGQKRGGA